MFLGACQWHESSCRIHHLSLTDSDDIPELVLISVEIFPITTLLAVVEWEIGLVPPKVEALIQMKTIVGVTNKVSILIDCQACVLKLLHKKINLGGEHVHLFKLVNLVGAGLTTLLIAALARGHLLNQFTSFLNTESEERTSSSSIYMLPG
jgi:hypothetical protein